MSKTTSIIIYMITFGISLIVCKLYQNYSIKTNDNMQWYKRFAWLLLIIVGPVFISTIRYDVGTDYFSYVRIFNEVNTLGMDYILRRYGNEPLYLILNKTAFLLFKDPFGIFLLSSFLIHIFMILGIDFFKKYLSMPMALFIYYMLHFNFGLNGTRQMIAMTIVFYSLRYIYQKKLFKYLFFIIMATMFHNSAIICILFYVVVYLGYNLKANNIVKKLIYYTMILTSHIIVLLVFRLLIKISIFAQYEKFISNEVDIGIGFIIDIIPIIFPILFFRKQIVKRSQLFQPFIDLLLLNIPFRIVGYFVYYGGRIALYTNIFYYIMPAVLINSLDKKNNKRIVCIYYIVYFILHYIKSFIINNYQEVYPYITIFG